MRKKLLISLTILFLSNLILSVAGKEKLKDFPKDVEAVLIKAANNRVELESFLNNYVNDSLKWDAACFLIKNMDIHYSEVYNFADSTGNMLNYNELNFNNYSEAKRALDSLYKQQKIKPIIRKEYDIHHIKAAYLIDNLERAFNVWKTPQSNHLSFDEFCEYLLPYRNATEKLEDWRQKYEEMFSPNNNSSYNSSVHESVYKLINLLTGYFTNSYSYDAKNNPVSFLSPSQLLFRKRGHCEDMVNFTTLVFKSQGVPCRIDMVPYYGTSTGSHYWNATIDKEHGHFAFDSSSNPSEDFSLKREPVKVITITYAKQKDALASLIPQDEIPEGFLRTTNFKDITDQYWPVSDIKCHLANQKRHKIAYLTAFNGLAWRTAYWGKINEDNEAHFSKMACGVAYLPMVYENGKLIPASYPILLFDDKSTLTLQPDVENTHNILLHEKERYLKYRANKQYNLYYWDNQWKLISKKIAKEGDTSLQFENVPKNALLVMIPEYSQGKERPFYISPTGERLWW